jgi:hypothetical protein
MLQRRGPDVAHQFSIVQPYRLTHSPTQRVGYVPCTCSITAYRIALGTPFWCSDGDAFGSQPAMRLPFGRSSSWGRSGIQIAKRFQKLFPADFIKNHENQKKSVKFGTKCNF